MAKMSDNKMGSEDYEIKTENDDSELETTDNFDLTDELPTYFYTLVGNIPPNFRSTDLRNYFSGFVEDDKVNCFHFRHRPQTVNISHSVEESSISTPKSTLCSIVRFLEESHMLAFLRKYHGKFWMDKVGNELVGRCVVQKVRLSPEELVKFSKELHPPRFMPKGNVGTRNSYFLNLIKQCVLPPSLIKKLNLEFPRARSYKKYSKVPFDYGTRIERESFTPGEAFEDGTVRTGKGHLLSTNSSASASSATKSSIPRPSTSSVGHNKHCDNQNSDNEADSDANEDEDLCEEWERHESLNDDVTSQERSKERLYEEEIELVWEKGGPGIVWWTDAQYWDAQRGDFDERTTDDLDVDMEGYYVPGGGDKDARDLLEIRQSERFREGLDEDISVFKRPEVTTEVKAELRRRRRSPSPTPTPSHNPRKSKKSKIGEFELFTKGFGRNLMEKQGWKDGVGLGNVRNLGIPEALENDGQAPRDKRGFGYYGEKIEWGTRRKRPKHSHSSNPFGLDEDDRVIIGTVYDKPNDLDKEEPLRRSNAPTFIKRYYYQKLKYANITNKN